MSCTHVPFHPHCTPATGQTPDTSYRNNPVKVIHGASDGIFDIAGMTVATLRASLSDAFNVPTEALAFVNGEQVEPSYGLLPNDTVEFVKQDGVKSILEPDEKAQLDRLEAMLTRLLEKPADYESPVAAKNACISTASPTSGVLTFGPIEVNKTENEATVDGKTYPLNLVRLEVLACLVARKGEWVTRKDMQDSSRKLKEEKHLERIIKALKNTVKALSPLIESSPKGYRIVLPEMVG